jgi:hypothetical protein
LSQFLHRHRDYFIMTINLSLFCQLFSGSGQICNAGTNYHSPGFAKIAPWWLARRDYFSAKVAGLVTANCATNAFCSYPLAVRAKRSNSKKSRNAQQCGGVVAVESECLQIF